VLIRSFICVALATTAAPVVAQTVAAGSGHVVILKPDGTVWTVGNNGSGQIGDNSTTTRMSPVQVSGLTDIVAIASGSLHSMALTSTGNLYLWGDNAYGQIGDGSTTMRKTPVQSSLANVVAIAGGSLFSVALKSNGDVYTWGRDNAGQLGDGMPGATHTTTPTLLTTGAAAIGAGNEFTLVVKTNGTVYGAGENSNYQLGDGTSTDRSSLVQMSGITAATAAAGGLQHSIVLLSDGTLKGVGYNGYGNLGDGSTTQRTSPVTVPNLSNITAIASGQHTVYARTSDGSDWAWGRNHVGQVGNADLGNDATSPVQLTSLSSISSIAAAISHSIAVSSDGVVYTWGYNAYYQLGDGTSVTRAVPTAISEAGYDWKVSTPTFDVTPGTYSVTKTVVVAITTSGGTIHYTENGSEPTESDPTITSGSGLSVLVSKTLKAKVFKFGMPGSNTTAAAYELKAVAPVITPANGTYATTQSMVMSSTTSGATVRYTISNTPGSPPATPTEVSTAYASALSTATYTIATAVAFKSGWTPSTATTRTLTFNYGAVPTPTADNGTGNYVDSVTVSLASTLSGAIVRYTTNGTAVQPTSTIYTAPLPFDTTTTLKFRAYHKDYATASGEVTHTYTLSPVTPVFNPTGGSYIGGQLVTVSGSTSGATIRYSINGAEPTTSDQVIASGSALVVGNYTLKAKAWKTGTAPSTTTSATYTISGTVAPPALAAGADYTLAIRSDGIAWGWGKNSSGQTGDGTTTTPRLLPRIVGGLTGAAAITAGDRHSHALTTDGTLVGFGSNTNGRLGDGTTTQRLLPTAITSVSAIVSVSNGGDHTLALKGDGTVYAWGYNIYGQLGDGTTTQRLSPTLNSGLTSVAAVAAGEEFSLALRQNGTVAAWGRNNSGQLGNTTTTNSSVPVAVASISTATAVSAGHSHALALLADRTVRSWGYNFDGQLGDGTTTTRSSPVEVVGLQDIVAIGAGASFSIALKDDGTVWSWGDNWSGSLGDGTTTDRSAAAQIAVLSDIVQIAVGSYHALAITSDGVVYAWGRNLEGQLGDGTLTNRLAPVAISGSAMNWRVPTPTISLATGLYYADQTVTVSIPDSDATLRYTTTGLDPTNSDATVVSGGTITIPQSHTLKVSGWRVGAVTSVVVARVYELKVVTPTITPGTGAYGSSQSVSMTTTTSGANFRYTTDGTEPTSASTAYSSAITIADTQTVKARAYKAGWTASDSGHASYWISSGTVATPTVTPAGGTPASPVVSMSTATTGATVRYTLDGTTPTATSAAFTYPFAVPVTTTLKVKAFKAGYTASATTTVSYDLDVAGAIATPAVVPGGGWYAVAQTVTISGPSGATLRYTTDGSDPTTASTSITSGNTLTIDKSQVVKVRAWASGFTESGVRRADFVITGAISAGTSHSLALASDGGVWAFGSDAFGQLGNGASGSVTTPTQVMTGALAMSAGDRHSLAVKVDGTVWAWGDGTSGKLGNGGAQGYYQSPMQISVTGAAAVAAGYQHSLVLKSDGTVWAFGRNDEGQLGDGTLINRTSAVQVTGITGVVAIAVARDVSYALQADGAAGGILWAWGANSYGQLGDGSTLSRPTPTRVTGVPNVTAMAAGKLTSFAIAIGATGQVYGWGENGDAQLGIGVTPNQTSAVTLPVITSGRLVGAGSDYAVVVDGTPRAWAWGKSWSGALGVGPGANEYDRVYTPQQSDIGGVLSVVGGDTHTLAIRPDGTILGFGQNSGRLGNGSETYSIEGVVAVGLTLADNSFLAGDADQDELATWREYLLGTDPLNADSNGNGIMDGHDHASGVNAADLDIDADGVLNSTERLKGTDPFRADTDGDGVSDLNDAFPHDPTRSMAPSSNPADTTPPVVMLKAPVNARPIP